MFYKTVEHRTTRNVIRSTYDRTRNRNLGLKRPTPNPLGPEGVSSKAAKFYVDCDTLQFYLNH